MNEPLVCFSFLLFIALYATLFSFSRNARKALLTCSRDTRLLRLLQWYNLAALFWSVFLVWTMSGVITFDYIGLSDFTVPPSNTSGPCEGVPDKFFVREIGIPPYLRWISLLSPIAGTIAFVLVIVSTRRYIQSRCPPSFSNLPILHPQMPTEAQIKEYIKWVTLPRTVLTLVRIGMPGVFAVMAIRATIRQWAIMTCTAWPNLHRSNPALTFQNVVTLEHATYTEDLAVATFFQFLAVLTFALSCSHAVRLPFCPRLGGPSANDLVHQLSNESVRDLNILTLMVLLPIYLYTFLGIVKCMISICHASGCATEALYGKALLIGCKDPVFKDEITVNTVTMFDTFLIVVCMLVVGNLQSVRHEFGGHVNLKFFATWVLLLIGQGQMTVLERCVTEAFQHARLLHSSLLCFECLVIAVVNLRLWSPGGHQPQAAPAALAAARESLLCADSKKEAV